MQTPTITERRGVLSKALDLDLLRCTWGSQMLREAARLKDSVYESRCSSSDPRLTAAHRQRNNRLLWG